jgi:hypothetical protein
MPLELGEYIDLLGLEGRDYDHSVNHLCELGQFGGYGSVDLKGGGLNVLKELGLDGLTNYADEVYRPRAFEWKNGGGDYDGFDYHGLDYDDFTDGFKEKIESGGFGERPFHEYLFLISKLVGGVSERLSSSLVRKLAGMEVRELVGLYYRSLLNLEKYLPRSTEKDLMSYGKVEQVDGARILNRYRRQILLSVIPGLCRLVITQKRSSDDDEFYPFEVAHPNPNVEDVYKHCLHLLRFAIGEKDKMLLQESVILREVSGLAEKYLVHTNAGEEIERLVSRVQAYRMGASMYQGQINASVYRGDITQPLVNYHSRKGVNVGYGCGIPPFVEAEASFHNPDANFYAVDRGFDDGVTCDHLDLSKHGLSSEPFGTTGNVFYTGADLDEDNICLPMEISKPDSVDTVVFGSSLHKLRTELRILVDYVLSGQLKEGGKCVVVSPAWSRISVGDKGGVQAKADYSVWLTQLFQDSTSNPHAIPPIEKFLEVPRYMREVHGIKVQIDSMGILFDSEENDTLNRFQIVYEVMDKRKGLRGRISRALRWISG